MARYGARWMYSCLGTSDASWTRCKERNSPPWSEPIFIIPVGGSLPPPLH